jgi:mono/diheme cytochrome c family protein
VTLATEPQGRPYMYALGFAILAGWLFFLLVSCGGSSAPAPAPTPADPAFAQVQPVVAKNCGGCHGVRPGLPVFASGAAFRASNARAELLTGAMPPAPHTISADDRAALLAYLQ